MFRFKQFGIRQENAAMKVGTDGALLGAWCNVSDAKNILDIGAGTAIISMMCAQRNPEASIVGIEIDQNALIDANFNVENCPWPNRISIEHTSLQNYFAMEKFDVIVSNPPFFENSLKSANNAKKTARHTDTLHFNEILSFAKENLSIEGHLALILPIENAEKCISEAVNYDLYLKRKCVVQSVPTKKPHRLVFELSKKEYPVIEEQLTIETGKRHDYTEEYIALGKEFYTIM